jgi:hypothetical protein
LSVLGAIALYRQYPAPVQKPAVLTLDIAEVPAVALRKVNARYTKVPLRDVLTDLARQMKEPVEIDSEALKREGLKLDQVVSVNPGLEEQMAVRDAVQQLNRALSDSNLIAVDFARSPILISSPDGVSRQHVTRLYPVGDLLAISMPWVEWERPDKRDEALRHFVMATVDPERWLVNGGRCRLETRDEVLMVTAPAGTQFRVERLLAALRKAR